MGTVTLIRSLLIAALAGLGTFALPATALFVSSMVIALVGFVSGRVLPGDIAGSDGWCTGGGHAGTTFAR